MNAQPDDKAPRSGGIDDALQREIDEALGGGSIEDLLNESGPARHWPGAAGEIAPGQIRRCRVASVDPEGVLVELGRKDQGVVPLEQFADEPEVGDALDLEIVRYDDNEDLWVLSRHGAVERATWDNLAEGQIVEAFVEKTNKGGLEVRFSGIQAFMPISQISLYRVEDATEYVGTKLRCQVVEVNRRDDRVIVSARAVLELEAEQKREQLLAELEEGQVRPGVVRQIMPFGAFVDLGGMDGLVHVSQMSYARVEDPAEFVEVGQTIEVMVLKIDRDANRISLGMKQVAPDPWDAVEATYPPGTTVTAQVVRLETFGAFVQVVPGVDALVPISEISWTQRLRHPSDVLKTGETIQATVLKVEPDRRRMSLSIREAQANPWAGAADRFAPGSEHPGQITRLADFGAFVELTPGVEGLIHISELSDQHVRRAEDVVQVGQELTVRVLDADETNRRISLTLKGVYQDGQTPAADAATEKPKKKRKRPLRGGLD